MKARLRHHSQSTINTIHLLHLGRRTIRLVSETDFAFLSAIEKKISPWCSATRSLLLRDAAVAPLAPVHPVRFTMRRGITRRSTPATTDWENAAPGCVCSGEQYWHRSHQLHDRGDLEDLGLLLINEAKSQSCLWVPCVRPAVWLSVGLWQCRQHVPANFTPALTRQRTSVHHSRAPPAAFLPGDCALACNTASTPWLCC
jgi:hypothetical protein